MSETGKMKRPDKTRWLYKGERGDYGPMSTDELLEAIAQRKVNLGTEVSVLGSNRWMPAGEVDMLRDHYGTLAPRWERDRLIAEAAVIEKKAELATKTKSAFGGVALFGTVVGLVLVGVLVWQFTAASPVGFKNMARAQTLQALPNPIGLLARGDGALPKVTERKVAVLSEPESYDTSGIGVGDGAGSHVTSFQFDEDGSVAAIPEADLQRIMASATAGLRSCALAAAERNANFPGTNVGFTVTPGALTKITVGAEARSNAPFQACVKQALARVSVPRFKGSERRVTIPLKVQR